MRLSLQPCQQIPNFSQKHTWIEDHHIWMSGLEMAQIEGEEPGALFTKYLIYMADDAGGLLVLKFVEQP